MGNPKFHQCTSCGYEWRHGKHGGHDCVETLNAHYEALRETAQNYQTDVLGYRKYALEIEALLAPEGSISLDGDERLGRILASIKTGVNALREKCEELQRIVQNSHNVYRHYVKCDTVMDFAKFISDAREMLDEAAKQKSREDDTHL